MDGKTQSWGQLYNCFCFSFFRFRCSGRSAIYVYTDLLLFMMGTAEGAADVK